MTLHHPDHSEYRHFTKRQRVDKAVHTLTGILKGIAIDSKINAEELKEVRNWCNDYRPIVIRAPFSELIPKIDQILADGIVQSEEQEEILWMCNNLSPEGVFYDQITHDIQLLQGVLHGILADDKITTEEAKQLEKWIDDNDHLKGSYPYDELESILMTALSDGIIDSEEEKLLKSFLEDFIEYSLGKRIKKESQRVRASLSKEFTLPGVCATCPEIVFKGKVFTFTGASERAQRSTITEMIINKGGLFLPNLTQDTEYLVVGAAGNPCWAFSCYGRKVEKAVSLRKEGSPIVIVHEHDFWDAFEDQ